jgi:hypothetical protein
MPKTQKVHDLTSLEMEILRLHANASKIEKQLSNNLSYLKEHAVAVMVNSIFCSKKKEDKRENGQGFFKNERLNSFISKVTNKITGRIGGFFDEMWNREKQ